MSRRFWLLLHRYVGLAMTAFLVIVGLTGSLLAFFAELDRLVAPHWYPPLSSGDLLDPGELALRAEMRVPQARVNSVYLGEAERAEVTIAPRSDPATGKPYELAHDTLLLDPVTGEEIGRRNWGAITDGVANLMPFIYKLHYELALGTFGIWVLGIAALAWTIDCFVGAYLTFPAGRGSGRSFWARWKPAWKVKRRAGAYRLNFDLHRAGGLWLWAMLLVFAWSSVYMNLWDTIYTWATRAVFEYKAPWTELPALPKELGQPGLGWPEAHAVARSLMDEQAAVHGFKVERVVAMRLDRERGVYRYQVRSDREIQDRRGTTEVFFDADSGALRLALRPSGQHTGNTVTNWLYALHEANVFGLPYRIFVCVLGLVIVMLSVTGVVIWDRKRRARKAGGASRSRRAAALHPTEV